MSKGNSTIDERLWQRVLNSKQVQGLAWKIEQAAQKESEIRELVKMLVEKWAEAMHVHRYFPDLKDVFTPEAVFCIAYASKNEPATYAYGALSYISNVAVNHDVSPAELKRVYNRYVSRYGERAIKELPLFDVDKVEDARLSINKKLFIPPAAQVATKPKKKRRGKIVREVEEQLNSLEPKFSIQNGRLIIT